MARILLSAYACEPGRGSEPGVGWGWATELAKLGHQVWVLTRADNRISIVDNPPEDTRHLKFIYYDLPVWMERSRKRPGGKALYYFMWQWYAARHVRKVFPSLPFDTVHHVTYVSVRHPSFLVSLKLPFCFGPVSGGEQIPYRLRSGLSGGARLRELLRDISNRLIAFDPLMRSVFRRAEKILVTRDTLRLIPRRWRHKCEVRLAVGLTREYLSEAASAPSGNNGCLRLLYAGRLLEWKGIDIALHAVKELRSRGDVRFVVVGDGPAKPKLAKLASTLGLSDVVQWTGWLAQREVDHHYSSADIFVFPSLRDSGGLVVLEAMAHGLPVVCTDLGGPGVIVNEHCGRVVQTLGVSQEQLAASMADAVREIVDTPGLQKRLATGARIRAQDFDFGKLVESVYPATPTESIAQTACEQMPVGA